MSTPFELLLFSTHQAVIEPIVAAGGRGVVVDWEWIGKAARQAGADTEVNHDTPADLRRVRACTCVPVICRVNRPGTMTHDEIEEAIHGGADEILLPMVNTPAEVEGVLELVRGRCGVGILIETEAATRRGTDFARLPLSRVYVGLNDLAISRRTSNIFTALIDGTLDHLRSHFDIPFGFGGLTLPERGSPIPCRLLIGEMARLRCSFSFLRRSFHRDIRGRQPSVEVPRLLAALDDARRRPPACVERDRRELERAVRQADGEWTARAASLSNG